MIHAGIDLHSTNMVNVAINDNDELVRQSKVPTSRRSLEEFFLGFTEPVQAVVECTSNWYWLSDWFREHDIPLKLAHAKMVKAIGYAKVKTDKVDARTLAELGIQELIQLQKHIHTLEEAIEQTGDFTRELELLAPIPGMGMVGGWTVLAEVGDISRFTSDKKFLSYSRLVPGSRDSGGSRRHKSGCKDGNKYLRIVFGDAAVAGYTHYPAVKRFYQKIKRRSGKNIARAVVAKELAKITWHVLSKGEAYKGFKGQPTRVASPACWPQPINPFA